MDIPIKPVAGKKLLYVMAAEAEYGPHLQARFKPLISGVGPIEAGMTLSAALARLDERGSLPDLVISLGSAGSATLEQTGIYQARSVSYRDMDASALGFEKGVTPFLALPAEIGLSPLVPGFETARLSTGANVVSGAAYKAIDADMVDMESFAHLRACQHASVALIVIRGISDGIAELNHIDDWTQYLHIIDEKLSDAVDILENWIKSGQFD